MSKHSDSKAQPAPTGQGAPVTVEVVSDLLERRTHGIAKYGTELRAGNGREALVDAYQESLDLVMYLKQKLMEGDSVLTTNPAHDFSERELELLLIGIDGWHAAIFGGETLNAKRLTEATTRSELADLFYKVSRILAS